jgi:hypothetical protein
MIQQHVDVGNGILPLNGQCVNGPIIHTHPEFAILLLDEKGDP